MRTKKAKDPAGRLWQDIERVANALSGACVQVDKLAGLLTATTLTASDEEIAAGRQTLSEAAASVERLAQAVAAQRPGVVEQKRGWSLPSDFPLSEEDDLWAGRIDNMIFQLLLLRGAPGTGPLPDRYNPRGMGKSSRAVIGRMYLAMRGSEPESMSERKEIVRNALDHAHAAVRLRVHDMKLSTRQCRELRLRKARWVLNEFFPNATLDDDVIGLAVEHWKTGDHTVWPAVADLCACVGALKPNVVAKLRSGDDLARRKAIDSVRVLFAKSTKA